VVSAAFLEKRLVTFVSLKFGLTDLL
jgi:hypothetical protein